jgi:hypothetical protein
LPKTCKRRGESEWELPQAVAGREVVCLGWHQVSPLPGLGNFLARRIPGADAPPVLHAAALRRRRLNGLGVDGAAGRGADRFWRAGDSAVSACAFLKPAAQARDTVVWFVGVVAARPLGMIPSDGMPRRTWLGVGGADHYGNPRETCHQAVVRCATHSHPSEAAPAILSVTRFALATAIAGR